MNNGVRLTIWDRILRRRVVEPNGCWLWSGVRDAGGYGRISNVKIDSTEKTGFAVHRLVAHLVYGLNLNDRNQYACHHCDNPPCFNPSHIFVGTPKQNKADSISKGRSTQPMFGVLNGGGGKLTEDQVREIRRRRELGERQYAIAADFGIDQTMVSMIVLRKKWSHVA